MSAKFPGIIQPAEEPEVQVLNDILTQVTLTNTKLTAQATGGAVTGVLQTPAGVVLTVKYKNAVIAAAGTDTAFIAAVTSKKIRVLQVSLDCGATATALTFNSKPSGAGAAIYGPITQAISEHTTVPYSPQGWFDTVAGEGLSITTGAGSSTTVTVAYVEV